MRKNGRPAKVMEDERATRFLYYWLLLAIFFEYARPSAFVPAIGALKLQSLIPLTLLVTTLLAGGLRSFREIFLQPHSKWLLAFMLLILLSVPFAEVTLNAYNMFKTVLGFFFMFLIIARVVVSESRICGVFATLIAAHLFLIAMSPSVIINSGVRNYIAGGTFLGDGNDFALSLCILIPMSAYLGLRSQSWIPKTAALVCMVISVVTVVATQSRGGTLAALAVLAFLWLLSKRKLASLMAIAILVGAAGLYASDAYFERMGTVTDYENDGSAQGRIIAWKAATKMALDNPLIGVGAGHFGIAFGTRYMPRDQGFMPWLTAHSTYFLVLGELGFPGLIVMIALVFGNMRANLETRRRFLRVVGSANPGRLIRSTPDQRVAQILYCMTASLVGFAVAGAFLSAAYYPHIFVLTGLCVAARGLVPQRSEEIRSHGNRDRSHQRPLARINRPSPLQSRRQIGA